MRRLILLLTMLAVPAAALEHPMTATEFEAFSNGKTLSYTVQGEPYGTETYMAHHRVIWAFVGQRCKTGQWYASGPDICFVYDGETRGPQCWRFYAHGAGLSAVFQGDTGGQSPIEVRQSPTPLVCPGPKVGV